MTTEVVPIPELELVVSRPPEVVLEEARRAAVALKEVIDGKPNPVLFNGEKYLEFEDWQTVGRFYGISPRITATNFVVFGDVKGWEATAEAVQVASDRIVSRAEAMCLNDEPKWSTRPKYEWHYVRKSGGTSAEDPGREEIIWEKGKDNKSRPKKERVLVGQEAVPLFQLRSMAQTRACAKAMRNALAWVVVLAGFKPTPAEEMDGVIHGAKDMGSAEVVNDTQPRTVQQPKAKSETAPTDPGKKATDSQVNFIRKKLTGTVKEETLCAQFKVEKLEDLPFADVNKALVWLGEQTPE